MPRPSTPVVLISLWLASWGVAVLAATRAYGAPLEEQALVMPPAKTCIDGATWAALADDTGFYAPEGLSEEEIGSALGPFLPALGRCVPAGRAISAQVTVHIEAACSGRVTRVRTVEDGGLSPAMISCFEHTLRYAELPAHDAPEGFGFDYRLRLMFLDPPKGR
jgi:hypothetical protein